ncbi:REP-associated tyrosine transposase [Yoonia algicola]|uniref:Transposase n=1 Tax=Yoonia algicola TaxID=3137368 RepID=A0AAN0NIM4_9RHOB
MSKYRRPKRAGATVFFTVNLANRASDLLVREIAVLRQAVAQTRAARPFVIDAFVVLPDHMHCVWTLPAGDADYSVRMGAIKGRFTQMDRRSGFSPTLTENNRHGVVGGRTSVGENPDHRAEAPIWQKRFYEHHIRNDRDYAAHVNYCWINPVKHGLVEDVRDWPYASWHRDYGDVWTVGRGFPRQSGG